VSPTSFQGGRGDEDGFRYARARIRPLRYGTGACRPDLLALTGRARAEPDGAQCLRLLLTRRSRAHAPAHHGHWIEEAPVGPIQATSAADRTRGTGLQCARAGARGRVAVAAARHRIADTRRLASAAALTSGARGLHLLEARGSLPAAKARGPDLVRARPVTAWWESRCHRRPNAITERQHRKPSEHLANGHRPTLLRLVRPLAYHLTPLTSAPATRRRGTRTFGRARRSLAPR